MASQRLLLSHAGAFDSHPREGPPQSHRPSAVTTEPETRVRSLRRGRTVPVEPLSASRRRGPVRSDLALRAARTSEGAVGMGPHLPGGWRYDHLHGDRARRFPRPRLFQVTPPPDGAMKKSWDSHSRLPTALGNPRLTGCRRWQPRIFSRPPTTALC